MENQPTKAKQPIKTTSLLFLTLITTTSLFAQDSNITKTGLTTGRLESILIGILGLVSLILGIRHFRSSKNPASPDKRKGVIIAGLAGLVCVTLAGVHIANATGGFGTGSGKAGAIVASALGLTGIILSVVSLTRLRHTS